MVKPISRCISEVKNVTKFVKNVEIVEFHDLMWNHSEKCIQIGTNIPGIGSLIREITVKFKKANRLIWESKQTFAQ